MIPVQTLARPCSSTTSLLCFQQSWRATPWEVVSQEGLGLTCGGRPAGYPGPHTLRGEYREPSSPRLICPWGQVRCVLLRSLVYAFSPQRSN